MKKILITIFILFGFSGTLSAADQGQMRFGVELGFSPVDLEAEKTAQELANLSGSTVTVEYDTGSVVGRLFGEYGLSSNLDLEIGYFTTSDAEAKYTISGSSAKESYYADGFDFSLNIIGDDGFFGKVECTLQQFMVMQALQLVEQLMLCLLAEMDLGLYLD